MSHKIFEIKPLIRKYCFSQDQIKKKQKEFSILIIGGSQGAKNLTICLKKI